MSTRNPQISHIYNPCSHSLNYLSQVLIKFSFLTHSKYLSYSHLLSNNEQSQVHKYTHSQYINTYMAPLRLSCGAHILCYQIHVHHVRKDHLFPNHSGTVKYKSHILEANIVHITHGSRTYLRSHGQLTYQLTNKSFTVLCP